jgi:hypothetical protein
VNRQLILREGLGREEIQGPRGRIGEDPVHHGDVVAKRLARGRGRRHHHVTAGEGVLDGPGLMRIEPVDATPGEGGAQARVDAGREVLVPGLLGRQPADRGDETVGLIRAFDRPLAGNDFAQCEVERRVATLVAPGWKPRLRGHTGIVLASRVPIKRRKSGRPSLRPCARTGVA